MSTTWLIWDDEGEPPKGKWIPVLWRSYGVGGDIAYCIPRLIEEQADTLRSRFLAYIYELGKAQIKGKRIVDHLELRPGFSYWWMTLIAEKSNAYKSRQITDVLKLLVLEKLVITHSVSTIILVSGDKTLVQAFRLWCNNAGLLFEWRALQESKEHVSLVKNLYRKLPQFLRAIIYLASYIWQRWPLKQQNADQNTADNTDITFVDYLIHLDQKALTSGRFDSNYWTDLVGVLDDSGSKVNWLHHYVQHEEVSSTNQVRDLIEQFNQSGTGRQYHACLDGALSISLMISTLIDYSHLVWKSLRMTKIKRQFRPTETTLELWPLFRQDWLNTMRGPNAIWNCLVLNLLERTLRRLPHQKLCVYLQENQGWEMALIYFWRAAGHGRLIGVPHSTIRYWDLRYYFDHRNYQRTGKNDLPMPDKVALNGPAAIAAYKQGGYPVHQMVEVEALRYLYLAIMPSIKTCGNDPLRCPLRVLVLGDYLQSFTRRQMEWLVAAAPLLPPDTRYVVKPHPACPVLPKDYPSLQIHVVSTPLAKLLVEFDVAFTSNITSAAVDAYCIDLPVVSVLDSNSFNMSPLRGLGGAVYVTNPTELADALLSARDCAHMVAEPFFCLDKELPRWRKLLGLRPSCVAKYGEA